MGTILVTGAGGGIGAATASLLAHSGLSVALTDVRREPSEEVAARIRSEGGLATVHELDVSDPDAVERVLDEIESQGPLAGAVLAAGVITITPFLELTFEQWRTTMRINADGTFLCLHTAAKRMAASGEGGSIVAVASVAGRGPRALVADYAASKAAVISIVRSAAVALAQAGIRVNAVCPGVIDTEMTAGIHRTRAAREGITPEASLARVLDTIAFGRIGTAEEVAEVIAFLLSDAAGYVTGQSINVCGGNEFD